MLEGRSLKEKKGKDIPAHKADYLGITLVIVLMNVFNISWLDVEDEHVFLLLLLLNVLFLRVHSPLFKLLVTAGYFLDDFLWVFTAIFYRFDFFGLQLLLEGKDFFIVFIVVDIVNF